MPRKVNVIGGSVRVEVELPWNRSIKGEEIAKHYRDCGDRLESTLKKLLRADLFSAESIHRELETEEVCSFCGRVWTEGKDAPHNGGCCEEDEKLMPPEEPAP